jgi:uncharacterized protein HemY
VDLRDRLERMLAQGQDTPELRFALGSQYGATRDFAAAIRHLRVAVALKPDYSAAWKLLGKLSAAAGDERAAMQAYRCGLAAAEQQGDLQAAREMKVFLARLEKKVAEEE